MKKFTMKFAMLTMLAVALAGFNSCELYDGGNLDGNWLSLEKGNTEAMMFNFRSSSKKGTQTEYELVLAKWNREEINSFRYDFSNYTGLLTVWYDNGSQETYDVSLLNTTTMVITIGGKSRTFTKVKSADINEAVAELIIDTVDDIIDNNDIEVPDTDYAPKNSDVRNYEFEVLTESIALTVKFESQYSVDPSVTKLNGKTTLAEYYYKDKNTAEIKFGEKKSQTVTLYFLTNKGGTAVYESEKGTFVFEKK